MRKGCRRMSHSSAGPYVPPGGGSRRSGGRQICSGGIAWAGAQGCTSQQCGWQTRRSCSTCKKNNENNLLGADNLGEIYDGCETFVL